MHSQFAGNPSEPLISLMTSEEITKEFSETYLRVKDKPAEILNIERFIALVENADKSKQREFAIQAICIFITRNLYADTKVMDKLTALATAPVSKPATTTVDALPDHSSTSTITSSALNTTTTLDLSEISITSVSENKTDTLRPICENATSAAADIDQAEVDIFAPANALLQTYLNYSMNHYIVTIVGILAKIGADTAIKSIDGQPILIRMMHFMSDSHTSIVADILKNKNAIKLKNNQEQGPLKYILDTWKQNSSYHYATIELLIAAGEDPNTCDDLGNNILHHMMGPQHYYIHQQYNYYLVNPVLLSRIQTLVKLGININAQNSAGKTPLEIAIANHKPQEILLGLIRAGANPNVKYVDGTPFFHMLCLQNTNGGNTRVIEYLLKNSTIPVDLSTSTDANNRTVMSALLDMPTLDVDTIFLLLDNGADPLKVNTAGKSLLHLLCKANTNRQHDHKITKLIHTYKFGVDRLDASGQTALQLVLHETPFPISTIDLLVRNGADPNIKNASGYPLLHLLHMQKADEARSVLFQLLTNKEYNINLYLGDKTGRNFQHYLLDQNPLDLEIIFMLFDLGMQQVTNSAGLSLLHVLCQSNSNNVNNKSILSLVAKYNISIDTPDARGLTPLQHEMNKKPFSFRAIQFYIENGANLNTVNSAGESLILLLEKNNENDQYRYLIAELIEKDVSCDVLLQYYMNEVKLDEKSFMRMKEIIDMGGSLQTKNNRGLTVEQYFIFNNQANVKGNGPYTNFINLLQVNGLIGKGYMGKRAYLEHPLVLAETRKPSTGFFGRKS